MVMDDIWNLLADTDPPDDYDDWLPEDEYPYGAEDDASAEYWGW